MLIEHARRALGAAQGLEVGGVGLFCGLRLVQDEARRKLWDSTLKAGQMVQNRAHERDLYLRSIAPDRISFMPPLITEEDEIAEAASILKTALVA